MLKLNKFEKKDPRSFLSPSSPPINELLDRMKNGIIKLPQFQRNFIWTRNQITDFLLSLFNNLPIGMFTLWRLKKHSNYYSSSRNITPHEGISHEKIDLVLDGQQRLSVILSVFTGSKIKIQNKWQSIDIAFNPYLNEFSFFSQKLPNEEMWIRLKFVNLDQYFKIPENREEFRNNYISNLEKMIDSKIIEPLSEEGKSLIRTRIEDLYRLPERFVEVQTLTIDNVELAFEILRALNLGTHFNKTDMLYATLSQCSEEIGTLFQNFTSILQKNLIPRVNIRFAVRLLYFFHYKEKFFRFTYNIHRIDPDSIKNLKISARFIFSEELLKEFIHILTENVLKLIGFDIKMKYPYDFICRKISRSSIYLVCYCYYALGKKRKIPKVLLQEKIAQWFLFSIITKRYEHLEAEWHRELHEIGGDQNFISFFDSKIHESLNKDFWDVKLPVMILGIKTMRNDIMKLYLLLQASIPVAFSHKYNISDYIFDKIEKNDKKRVKKFYIFNKKLMVKLNLDKWLLKSATNIIILDQGESSTQKLSKMDLPTDWGAFLATYENKVDSKIINPEFSSWDFPRTYQEELIKYEENEANLKEYISNFLNLRSKKMALKLQKIFTKGLK